jgi:hypothetical protein
MSTLRVNTLQNTSGVEVYTAKAWVNFNGTGTVAIRASGNVSSITDNGTGQYTVNFTTAMPDANYAFNVTGKRTTDSAVIGMGKGTGTLTSSAVQIKTTGTDAAGTDPEWVLVTIFR